MIKAIRFSAFILLISALLASCSPKAITDIDGLRGEDGIFTFPGLEWGMTVDEAAGSTGWDIPAPQDFFKKDTDIFSFSLTTVYDVAYGGYEWAVGLQFDENGGLWAVSYMLQDDPDKLRKIYDSTVEELITAYGQPDQLGPFPDAADPEADHCLWYNYNDQESLIQRFGLSYSVLETADDRAALSFASSYDIDGFKQ